MFPQLLISCIIYLDLFCRFKSHIQNCGKCKCLRKEVAIDGKWRQKRRVCITTSVCVCVLNLSASALPTPLSLYIYVCVCVSRLASRKGCVCLPAAEREGGVISRLLLPALSLSLLFLFRSHSLTGSLRIRPLSLCLSLCFLIFYLFQTEYVF